MQNLKRSIGSRLKKRRKQLHLTQENMAEKLNISIKHYGEVERGNAGLSLENLVEVSDILGVSLDYLIKGIDTCTTPFPEYSQLNDRQKKAAQEIITIIQHL